MLMSIPIRNEDAAKRELWNLSAGWAGFRFMRRHPFALFIIVIVLFFSFARARAQSSGWNFYQNILEPLALADLDSASVVPLHYVTGHGLPGAKDSLGANILASDTGGGVISYLWAAVPEADSTTSVRLWIDGTLVRQGTAGDFFIGDSTGLFVRSFDSVASGALDCDVQLPFRHSFRITYTSPQGNVWYAVGWRRLPVTAIGSTAAMPDSALLACEADAASVADKHSWGTGAGQSDDTAIVLTPKSSTVLYSLSGPAVLTSLLIKPSVSSSDWDSTWIQIFWNGSDSADVVAPLADFFGQGAGSVQLSSLPMWSDSDRGFGCNFPMPFEYSAKFVLVNEASVPIAITAGLVFHDTSLNWSTTGYFHAHFSESNPTRYGVFHPVLDWNGPGRFVGMNMAIPNNPYPCALEGDAIFNVDSTPSLSFEYTGTEDYFGGGFYFSDGEFSHPFNGCTQKWYSFYRFHILDAVDFKHSIDVEFQHGNNNDVSSDYRTVVYFYAPWPQSWVRCDTVTLGRLFTLYGSAYPARTFS